MKQNEGMNTLGKPIPQHRKEAALQLLHTLLPNIELTPLQILVRDAEHALEHDRPKVFFDVFKDHLDLTATYHLMAVYLTG